MAGLTVALTLARAGMRVTVFEQAEKLDPNLETTYVNRGNVYLLAQEFDKAENQFRRALELNPADSLARNGLDMAQRRITPSPAL